MWGLMLKDFLVMKWYIAVGGFLFGSMMLWLSRGTHPSPSGLSALWLLIWFILSRALFAFDEHGRSEAIVNSLPLSKREIVASRHLASLILLGYAFFVVLAWFVILKASGGYFTVAIRWAPVIAVGLISSAISAVILFPLLFKVDFVKARWITFFVMFLFIIPLFNPLPNSHNMETLPWIEALVKIPELLALGAAILVFAGLTILSIFLSTKLYQTREF